MCMMQSLSTLHSDHLHMNRAYAYVPDTGSGHESLDNLTAGRSFAFPLFRWRFFAGLRKLSRHPVHLPHSLHPRYLIVQKIAAFGAPLHVILDSLFRTTG